MSETRAVYITRKDQIYRYRVEIIVNPCAPRTNITFEQVACHDHRQMFIEPIGRVMDAILVESRCPFCLLQERIEEEMSELRAVHNVDTDRIETGKFDILLVDPPWDFEVWNRDTGSGRSASAHYNTMSLEAICALPVKELAAKNCALFLWAVWPRIFDAQKVIEAWGFTYKTLAWEWIKLNPSGVGFHLGMGYYTRANPEPCLLAVRGLMPVATRSERNLIITPVMAHSRKPDDQYHKIEALYPNRRYLELFARRRWPGWVSFGNGLDGKDITASLENACNFS